MRILSFLAFSAAGLSLAIPQGQAYQLQRGKCAAGFYQIADQCVPASSIYMGTDDGHCAVTADGKKKVCFDK